MASRKEGKTASKAARGVGAAIMEYAIGKESKIRGATEQLIAEIQQERNGWGMLKE